MPKVTFDGPNKLILVNSPETFLDVKIDIYGDWKEWAQTSGSIYLQAMRAVGGDPTVGGNFLGTTYFLMNGWKIRGWTGTYDLTIDGNLYSEDGSSPFVPMVGSGTLTIINTVSNIVDMVSGTGASPADVADAVRTELTTELSRIDTTISSRASQTSVDLIDALLNIVDAKVDSIQNDITAVTVDITDMLVIIELLQKLGINRHKIDPSTKTLTVYDNNGTTPIVVFSLLDSTQTPSVLEVLERVPV